MNFQPPDDEDPRDDDERAQLQVEHWTERHLRLRANYSAPIRMLLWIGFVKIGRRSHSCHIGQSGRLEYIEPEGIVWPFDWPSSWSIFRYHVRNAGQRFYLFRNCPGVIKRLPGRLLPRRWGFGICGFEFGDRG